MSPQSCTRAEYNTSLRAPRAGNIGRAPRDDNRDDIFNCHEVPIKEYLRKWNFVNFHLFVLAETYLCLQKQDSLSVSLSYILKC